MTLSQEDLNKKTRELEAYAHEKGADRAKTFSARSVVIDERVRMKCQIPLCAHYGRTLTCPPNIPTVEEFKKALSRYKKALLVQMVSPLSGDAECHDREEVWEFTKSPAKKTQKKGGDNPTDVDDFANVKNAANRLHKLVNEVELKAMGLGFHYALGLIGGECMMCAECVGVGSGHACRRPYEARPSMEGVGIDVVATSEKAGLPFEIPPRNEIVWSGLVLIV